MNIHEKANGHVVMVENRHVTDLFVTLAQAKRKAEKCGCPECLKFYDKAERWIAKELDRLAPRNEDFMDHEEMQLAMVAWNKLLQSDDLFK